MYGFIVSCSSDFASHLTNSKEDISKNSSSSASAPCTVTTDQTSNELAPCSTT